MKVRRIRLLVCLPAHPFRYGPSAGVTLSWQHPCLSDWHGGALGTDGEQKKKTGKYLLGENLKTTVYCINLYQGTTKQGLNI